MFIPIRPNPTIPILILPAPVVYVSYLYLVPSLLSLGFAVNRAGARHSASRLSLSCFNATMTVYLYAPCSMLYALLAGSSLQIEEKLQPFLYPFREDFGREKIPCDSFVDLSQSRIGMYSRSQGGELHLSV